jgi:Flp pilus assembly protein TadG
MSIFNQSRRRKSQAGNAMVEVALMSPWIFFLFVGVFDMGFYAYAIICTENAARAAAMQTAASVNAANASVAALACPAVLKEMNLLLNVGGGITTCAANALAVDAANPVGVEKKTLCGASPPSGVVCDATPCADCVAVPSAVSSQVAVTYQSNGFIPIPGILTNKLTLTRIAEMRILVK